MSNQVKISKNVRTFGDLLDEKYGKIGTPKRDKFEADSKKWMQKELKKFYNQKP